MKATVMTAFTRPPVKNPCVVCRALAALDDDVSARAKDAIEAGKDVWPHTAIVDNFYGLGQHVSETSVRTHRKRCA